MFVDETLRDISYARSAGSYYGRITAAEENVYGGTMMKKEKPGPWSGGRAGPGRGRKLTQVASVSSGGGGGAHLSRSRVEKRAGLLIQISVVTCDSSMTLADVWKYAWEIILKERHPNPPGNVTQTQKFCPPPTPPELSR